MKTYLNDAIIGNKELKVSLTDRGEIVRICYPNVDYRQFIDFLHMGVKINDSNIIYLHDDVNNEYMQGYIEDTNVLKTEIINRYFNLKVEQTDFVPIGKNAIIRKYVFSNEHDIPLNIKLLVHSKLISNENEFVGAKVIDNGLLQYSHGYNMEIVSNDLKFDSYNINGTDDVINSGILYDKDYIGMSNNSALDFEIGVLNPKQKKEFSIIFYVFDNKENMHQLETKIDETKKIDVKKELQTTKQYWKKYLKAHIKHNIDENNYYKERVNKIYKRTILLFPLLTNQTTGGVSAAMEIDETFSKCGKYSYCWPRDAIYVTKAQDYLKMEKETEKFYKVFCKNTQSKSGMWEQRFFSDGTLAPCWGYQIDETASIVYGVYDHYLRTKELKFLKDNLGMLEKAVKFLENYLDDALNEKNEMRVSYDLWEMHEGTSIYALSCIFGSYDAMIKIYDAIYEEFSNNRLKQENISKQKDILNKRLEEIKKYILKRFYDDEKKSFVRNEKDKKLDISILGLVTPFEIFSPNEKKITNTVDRINMTLRTYTGGYLRFEQDHYTDNRPWVIATLWMALYYIKAKKIKEAKECFDFIVNTSTKHGFLAEQVDNNTMSSSWVIGLAWSHAMFVIVLEELMKLGEI